MHEFDYMVPPQALWEWDDGQSMYPPNTNEPMVIYRGADSSYTPVFDELPEVGTGTLMLTIRDREGRKAYDVELNNLEDEIFIPADTTKDMHEGRHQYFFDIMLVTENGRQVIMPVTPVHVYPTAGGIQYR